MKIYVVSGLGADFKVLERLEFPPNYEPVFIDWLIPESNEPFDDYVKRMAEKVDDSEPFCLLGYSFGGIIVQEINQLKPAEKVVILGSIKSDKEKSKFIKTGEVTKIPRILPVGLFNNRAAQVYSVVRKLFDPRNPKILEYFKVRDPYYLKWSVEKVSEWKFEENPNVIQILGDKDIVFPIRYSKPDYVIKGGSHLFPVTKHKEVSKILAKVFSEKMINVIS
ncbi:alpha/beta hydrolase [Chryseobacterium sp. WG14]|uniref:alpha/beta hydrolase n=1 Tax=unclassified Chryseobacterium TaxID=2593645 RepID=UPI00211DA6F3|nr:MULTISPECIES: alpha/beta hydrolase [unclassified Chryseobacterium]MCQ9635473.1 alpha/beta hydrolase [Chryseobacterium sp. WG23]MCQ9638720.1 alpha/beta hydrolase [Chryseobacterium sp. WG14]